MNFFFKEKKENERKKFGQKKREKDFFWFVEKIKNTI